MCFGILQFFDSGHILVSLKEKLVFSVIFAHMHRKNLDIQQNGNDSYFLVLRFFSCFACIF